MTAQIDAHSLKALMDADRVKVVDGSWALDGTDMRALYAEGHIPGAQFFDIDTISDTSTDLPHMAPPPSFFAQAVGALGISESDQVVIYDRQGLFSAARVWWTFRLMGHRNVQVLRGGLPAWQAAGYLLQAGAEWVKGVTYTPNEDKNIIIDVNSLKNTLSRSDQLVLDARPANRFAGTAPEPRAGLRSGHIPGSHSLPASALIADGALKPVDDLRCIFDTYQISPDTHVVTTCGSGVTAAILALALHEVGHDRVRLFDGSWAQWGRDDMDTPVVTSA